MQLLQPSAILFFVLADDFTQQESLLLQKGSKNTKILEDFETTGGGREVGVIVADIKCENLLTSYMELENLDLSTNLVTLLTMFTVPSNIAITGGVTVNSTQLFTDQNCPELD